MYGRRGQYDCTRKPEVHQDSRVGPARGRHRYHWSHRPCTAGAWRYHVPRASRRRRCREVVDRNDNAVDGPELINQSPFDDAWLIKVKVSDPSQLESLMDPSAYEEFANEG